MSVKFDAKAFGERWVSDWNRRDVEGVLSHFSENVVFRSARATGITGSPTVVGKSNLREYWTDALQGIQSLRFTLDYILHDGARLAIVYIAEIDGRRIRSVEFFVLDADGLVTQGEAMYGIDVK